MESLEVPAPLTARWNNLPAPVRRYLAAFLGTEVRAPGERPERVAVVAPGPAAAVPAPFADDLADGGGQLRAAFPQLERRVASIDGIDSLEIRIVCEGSHDGAFYGFMLPTRRRVRFEVTHHLTLDHGRVAEDRIALDVRSLVRQLATG